MNQEYQVLVALDLLTTQMNKYANKKLKPYGLKFNELNIIRFVAQTNWFIKKRFVKIFNCLIRQLWELFFV